MKTYKPDDAFGQLPDNVSTRSQDRWDAGFESADHTGNWVSEVKATDGHFCRVRDRAGNSAGLGFFCPDCRLQITYGAPTQVRHCGSIEQAPHALETLPIRSL